ncbi:hypothetical protein [Rickettsiella endosymbiont of Aleochara curtula]|jgi:hypothetical protein|uniref:hypothetical protein n=1 Tax=Rickettsiella endosymbiont of Aleochara curtula TaxID=3077936 RepID=UPI00313CCBFC
MKLKQALVIGLSSAVLAIPAFAATSTFTTMNPATDANQPAAVTPAKKEAVHHRKGHKKVSLERKTDPKQAKDTAKLDELNTLNSAAEKAQTEKNTIKA